MAKVQKENYASKSVDELKALVTELKKELFNLRFQKASGELQNTARFAQAKKEIARILTQLRRAQNAA